MDVVSPEPEVDPLVLPDVSPVPVFEVLPEVSPPVDGDSEDDGEVGVDGDDGVVEPEVDPCEGSVLVGAVDVDLSPESLCLAASPVPETGPLVLPEVLPEVEPPVLPEALPDVSPVPVFEVLPEVSPPVDGDSEDDGEVGVDGDDGAELEEVEEVSPEGCKEIGMRS